MRSNFIRHIAIIRWAALALLALTFIQLPARAMEQGDPTTPRGNVHLHIYWGAQGWARGQALRYTWANLNDPDPQQQEFQPLHIQVKLFAADGVVIAQAEAPAVGAGQFQSFDFNRDQINLPGEPGTGRLQARLEVTVSGVHRNSDITLKRGVIETFDDVVEVIDNSGGRTTVGFSGGVNKMTLNDSSGNEYLNPEGFQIISAGKNPLIGVAPGQTLRINLLNSPSSGSEPQPVSGHVKVFDGGGNLIAQSPELDIPPGEFRSFNFNRAALQLPGEPGTGRLQVYARIIWKKLQLNSEFPTSVEIVDDITGKTTVLISQKPKEIVVVGSK